MERPTLVHIGLSMHGHARSERYRLRNLWCLHFYRYSADLKMGREWLVIRPGYVSVTPPGLDLEYRFRGPSEHLVAHFTFPAQARGDATVLAMDDLAHDFPNLMEEMHHAVRAFPVAPLRAEVRLWDILWTLSERNGQGIHGEQAPHPAFTRALQQIELGLGRELRVADLAHEVGLSHNQLTRLFKKETGATVIGYIHKRRAQWARHLLRDTTLPVKSIAAQVGIPDPHHFNKFIRRMWGVPPRALREGRVRSDE